MSDVWKNFKIEYYRSKHYDISNPPNACRVTYIPTGQSVECDAERSVYRNETKALRELWDNVLKFDPILLKT